MNKLTDIQKGYIAGMIDGEGTITINRCKQYRWENDSGYVLKPWVFIYNVSIDCLEKIKSIVGAGSVVSGSGTKSAKKCYAFRLVGHQNIYELLVQIRPHLLIKHKQADLVISFLESRSKNLNRKLPYIESEIQTQLAIKQLNKIGWTKTLY